jgi:N-acyl-phosphatidylethanolamine-hydrolysing phospholipase D
MRRHLVAISSTSILMLISLFTAAQQPAHHTENGFRNLYAAPIDKGPFSYLKMKYLGDEPFADHEADAHTVPIAKPDFKNILDPSEQAQITWLGHSSFLIQYQGLNILTDPILSDRASPVGFAGPKRLVDMPIKFEHLPTIDFIVISHNHYDHLDLDTILKFGNNTLYIVPLKLKEWFVNEGIATNKVIEFDWWDKRFFHSDSDTNNATITFTATPSQHWSARGLFDRYNSLWASWHIQIGNFSLWFAGDTGYNEVQFKEIGQHFSSIDLALIPIGAYAPRWFMQPQHVNPEEAIKIHQDINAKKSIGMHWGTFQLTAEPILEPLTRLQTAHRSGLISKEEFTTISIGETLLQTIEPNKPPEPLIFTYTSEVKDNAKGS